jgi:hypothetical protein
LLGLVAGLGVSFYLIYVIYRIQIQPRARAAQQRVQRPAGERPEE